MHIYAKNKIHSSEKWLAVFSGIACKDWTAELWSIPQKVECVHFILSSIYTDGKYSFSQF